MNINSDGPLTRFQWILKVWIQHQKWKGKIRTEAGLFSWQLSETTDSLSKQ